MLPPRTPRYLRPCCVLVALAALLGAPGPGRAQVSAQLVNGLGELGEPTTVGLIQGTVPQDGFLVCSGVLIGCDSVITTAHCFNTNLALKTHIYVPHAGFYPIESATRHPAYVDALTLQPPGWIDTTREDDISFVKLASPVVGVTPAAIRTAAPPVAGTPGFVVGFGRDPVTETSLQNPGIKRSGAMQLADCTDPSLVGLDVLCWSPTNPLPEPGSEVSTCAGDSGGPLFTSDLGARVVTGITKGAIFDPQGQPDLCLPPVSPYDVSVARHAAWIGGADGAGGMVAATLAQPLGVKRCSAGAQLPDPTPPPGPCAGDPWGPGEEARSCGFEAMLGGAQPGSAQYSFPVPAGTETLRVALNGIAVSGTSIDTDLYVRAGQPATPVANDCGMNGSGTLGFCEFAAPAAGTWYALVQQAAGEGDHQLIVSLLGPDPPPIVGVPSVGTTGRGLLLAVISLLPWLLARRSSRSRR